MTVGLAQQFVAMLLAYRFGGVAVDHAYSRSVRRHGVRHKCCVRFYGFRLNWLFATTGEY